MISYLCSGQRISWQDMTPVVFTIDWCCSGESNTPWPGDAMCMEAQNWIIIGWANGLRLFGTNPSVEPLQTCCLSGPLKQMSVKFESNTMILIQENAFENIACKTSAILLRPLSVKTGSGVVGKLRKKYSLNCNIRIFDTPKWQIINLRFHPLMRIVFVGHVEYFPPNVCVNRCIKYQSVCSPPMSAICLSYSVDLSSVINKSQWSPGT